MASSEISRAKTIFVLAIVVGCFAVLWPKVFYPMFQGGVAPEVQHKDEPSHMKPERPAHLHPEVMHPGLREKGRTIPPSHDIRNGRPPIGVRPPMGAGAHVSNTQKGVGVGGGGAMSILMPLYTIGIVVFFVYTVMKVLFKKQPESEEPKIKDFGMDPEHRKFLYEAKIDEPEISARAMPDMQRATRIADVSPIPEPTDICLDVSELESKPVTTETEIIPLAAEEKSTQVVEKAVHLEKEEIVEEVVLPVKTGIQEQAVPASAAEPSEVVEEVQLSVQMKTQEEVTKASAAQPTEETEIASILKTESDAEKIAEVVEPVIKPESTGNQAEVVEEIIAVVKAASEVESSAAREDVTEAPEYQKADETQAEASQFAARNLEASAAEEIESDIIIEQATIEQSTATNEAVEETPTEQPKTEAVEFEAAADVTVKTEAAAETKEDQKVEVEDLLAERTVVAALAAESKSETEQSEPEVNSVEQAAVCEVDVSVTAIEGLAEPKIIEVKLLQNETAETVQPESISVESNVVGGAETEAVYQAEQGKELAEESESQIVLTEETTKEQPKEETAQASDLEPMAAEPTIEVEAGTVEPVREEEQESQKEEPEFVSEIQSSEEQLKEETIQASEPKPVESSIADKVETQAAEPKEEAEREHGTGPEIDAVREVQSPEEQLKQEIIQAAEPEPVESSITDKAEAEAAEPEEAKQERGKEPEIDAVPEVQSSEEQVKQENIQAAEPEPVESSITDKAEAEAAEPEEAKQERGKEPEIDAVPEVQSSEEQVKQENIQAAEPEPVESSIVDKAEAEAAEPEEAKQEREKEPEIDAVTEVQPSEEQPKEETIQVSEPETVLVESAVAGEAETEATEPEEKLGLAKESEFEAASERQTAEEQPKEETNYQETVSEPTAEESAAESEKQAGSELPKELESALTSDASKGENVHESEEEPIALESTVAAKAETGAAEQQTEEQLAKPETEAATSEPETEKELEQETIETGSTTVEEQPQEVTNGPESETASSETVPVAELEAPSVEQAEGPSPQLEKSPDAESVSSQPSAINETEKAITVTEDKEVELTSDGAVMEPTPVLNETLVAETEEESKPETVELPESESVQPTVVVDAATTEADVKPESTEVVEPGDTPAEPVTDSQPTESTAESTPSSAALNEEALAEVESEKPVVEVDEAGKVTAPEPATETEQPVPSVDPEQTAEADLSQPTDEDTANKEMQTPAADTVTESAEQTSETSILEPSTEDNSVTVGVVVEPVVDKQEPEPSAADDATKDETSEPAAPKEEDKLEEKPTEDVLQPETTVELKPSDIEATEEKAEAVVIPEPVPEVPTETEEEIRETTPTEDKKDGEEPQKDDAVDEKVEAGKPDAPSHMISIEDDRLLAIEEMIETDMSFFLDTPNIPISEAMVTPTTIRSVTSRRGSLEEVDEVVEKVVVKPYIIDHDDEAGESVEDLLRQAIGDEIKTERVTEAAGAVAADQFEQTVADIAVDEITATDQSQVTDQSEAVETVVKTETELKPQPVLAICVPAPEPAEGFAECQIEQETVPQDEAVETNATEDVTVDTESGNVEIAASSADREPSINVVGETVETVVEKEAVDSQTGLVESISSEVFPTEYEFLEKEADTVNQQTEVTNTCEVEAPVEASCVETTNQSTPVGEVSHPLGGTPEVSEENKDDVVKFGECCSGTCVQDLIQPEVPQYREMYTDSDVQKRLDDLRKQKELEMDLLRKRLEETEAAMERIVAQMGTASEKLLTREQYDKDLSSTKKRLQEAEEHLEKLKAAKTSEDINELLSVVSSTSVLDTTILPEQEETQPQEKPSVPFGADAIATSETKISVVGMEVTAQSQDGSKLPRPVTPVKHAAKLNEQGEVTSVLLEALVPSDSQLLVSEAECRAEAVPLEQLDLDESEYEAAPVVLSGKMTLSVMGMELLADPEPPVEHEADITEADDVTMPSEAVDEKEGSAEPGVVEEFILPEASCHHEAAERTTKVRFADTPPQEMIIEEYEDYENENGEPNAEETMTGEDDEDCNSKFKTVVIDTILEGEHAEAKKDEHPSDEEIQQALSDVKKELAAKRGNNTRADSVDEIMKAVEEARKFSSKPILSESVSADEPLQTFSVEHHAHQGASPVVDPEVYGTTEQLSTLVQEEAVPTAEQKDEVPEATEEKVTEKSESVAEIEQSTQDLSTEPAEECINEGTTTVQVQMTEEESTEAETSSGQDEKAQEAGQKTDTAVRQEPPSTLAIQVVDTVPEFVVTPTEEEEREDIPTEDDGEQKVSVSTKFLTNLRQDSLRDSASKLKDSALGRSMEITELVIKGPNIEEETEAQAEEEAEEAETEEIQQSTRVSSQDIKPETKQVVVSTRSNEEPELQTEIENAMKEESLPASKGSSPDMEDFEVVKTEVLTSRLQPTATEESSTLAAEKPAEEGVRSSSTESSSYEMVGNNESVSNHSPSPLESTDSTFVPVSEEKKE